MEIWRYGYYDIDTGRSDRDTTPIEVHLEGKEDMKDIMLSHDT